MQRTMSSDDEILPIDRQTSASRRNEETQAKETVVGPTATAAFAEAKSDPAMLTFVKNSLHRNDERMTEVAVAAHSEAIRRLLGSHSIGRETEISPQATSNVDDRDLPHDAAALSAFDVRRRFRKSR